LRKGADADPTLQKLHAKIQEINDHILPAGVKLVPYLDRSNLVRYTTNTVLHNLAEGIILVVIILFLFLGNARGAIIVALTIPFSLLFAATCLNLKGIPANLLSLGALDFGMVVDGAVVMVENIVRHLGRRNANHRSPMQKIFDAAHEVQRPVFYAIAIIITAYLPIFTLQRVEGRLFKPMAWCDPLFYDSRAGASESILPDRYTRMAQPRHGVAEARIPECPKTSHPHALPDRWSRRCQPLPGDLSHRRRHHRF
jgi:cobalt-zinc-cadmium resistance protein CzcA